MKKILFVTSSVGIGGNEKALINILKAINKKKYDIYLLILDGNIDIRVLPNDITVVKLPENYNIVSKGFKSGCIQALKCFKLNLFFTLLAEKKLDFASGKRNYYINFWKAHKKYIECIPDSYDVAIAFGLGIQVPMTLDKISARQKIAWVNNDCSKCLDEEERSFLQDYYSEFNKIVTVTPAANYGFLKTFSKINTPTYIVKDLFDEHEIIEKAHNEVISFPKGKVGLVTVGRISHEKGYCLLIDTALKLRERDIDFYWTIVGNGDKSKYEQQVYELGLEGYVVFIGPKTNPYPYIACCDIYVQTSLWEGNCLTLIEAMVLEKPIVTTNFPSALEKITNGINGLISTMDAETLADKISTLIADKSLQKQFSEHLKVNRINNGAEMKKIYELIDGE